jgi:hypothetical protein
MQNRPLELVVDPALSDAGFSRVLTPRNLREASVPDRLSAEPNREQMPCEMGIW